MLFAPPNPQFIALRLGVWKTSPGFRLRVREPTRARDKYRFVRITPTKILYWAGYKVGRYIPKKQKGGLRGLFSDLAHQKEEESTLESIAKMLDSYEEEQEARAT